MEEWNIDLFGRHRPEPVLVWHGLRECHENVSNVMMNYVQHQFLHLTFTGASY